MKFWARFWDKVESMENWIFGFYLGVGLAIMSKLDFWTGLITIIFSAMLMYLRILRVFEGKRK